MMFCDEPEVDLLPFQFPVAVQESGDPVVVQVRVVELVGSVMEVGEAERETVIGPTLTTTVALDVASAVPAL